MFYQFFCNQRNENTDTAAPYTITEDTANNLLLERIKSAGKKSAETIAAIAATSAVSALLTTTFIAILEETKHHKNDYNPAQAFLSAFVGGLPLFAASWLFYSFFIYDGTNLLPKNALKQIALGLLIFGMTISAPKLGTEMIGDHIHSSERMEASCLSAVTITGILLAISSFMQYSPCRQVIKNDDAALITDTDTEDYKTALSDNGSIPEQVVTSAIHL